MNKILMIMGILLFPLELFAGTCTNNTVSSSSGYSFQLTNIGNPNIGGAQSFLYYAGRMVFNGAGRLTISGNETQAGNIRTFSASGTYSVAPSNCQLTVTFTLPASSVFTAKTFSLSVFLDRMDIVPSVNVAYHGNAVFRTNLGMSGVGEIDRLVGKF
jgi:hypothetical protein